MSPCLAHPTCSSAGDTFQYAWDDLAVEMPARPFAGV